MPQQPLADLMRPTKIRQFVGQDEIIGPPSRKASAGQGGIIRRLIENSRQTGFFPSLIFWGPPGSGKTTLARIIATELKCKFYEFSAVNTSIKDIEAVIKKLKKPGAEELKNQLLLSSKPTTFKGESLQGELAPIIFIDEIHRFNKAQQDKLLPYIEKGQIIFIGATTENPSFEVIGPLLSRSRVVVLKRLEEDGLQKILERALKKIERKISPDALNFLIESSNGDARVALNVLEIANSLNPKLKIKIEDIEQALQRRQFTFDKQGEEYYNVISAFIKSMRAGSADAALYYLARMIEAGQDPLYIARRMVVFASEDIGMAQPTALVVANEVFRACETIGYPECQENLAHGAVYLATAKKSRSAYDAYMKALTDVKKFGNLPVPLKIRNPVTKLMEDIGYGEGYEKYTKESLLPEKLKGKKYYP